MDAKQFVSWLYSNNFQITEQPLERSCNDQPALNINQAQALTDTAEKAADPNGHVWKELAPGQFNCTHCGQDKRNPPDKCRG